MSHDKNTDQGSLPSVQTDAERGIRWVYRWLRWSMLATWILLGILLWIILPTCPGSDYPAWSPDGKYIAFACSSGDIYIASMNGNWWRNLTNNHGERYDYPAWSPDGRQIAFSADLTNIYIINVDGSGQTNLTNELNRDTANPVWSPDGNKIVFQSLTGFNDDIYVMNADGSALKNLTKGLGFHGKPAWSPDGQQIAFLSYLADNTAEIDVINVDGSGIKKITGGLTDCPSDLAWSPDGQLLACGSDNGIKVINVDGSGLKTVSDSDGMWPAWSPDGQQIVFTVYNMHKIYIVNSDGSGTKELGKIAGLAYRPTWSPDGREIAIDSDDCSGFNLCFSSDAIYVINANGTNLHKLSLPPYGWLILLLVSQLILVIGLRSPFLYVRRHTQQAMILVGLNALMILALLWLTRFDNLLLQCGLILGPVFLSFFETSWGLRQVKNGDCWLMRLRGEEKELPRPWALHEQTSKNPIE